MAVNPATAVARWQVWLLIGMATVSVGFVDLRVRSYPDHGYAIYIPEVLAGNADAPGRYRVLAPFAYDAFRRVTGLSPAGSWYATTILWIGASFAALYAYLRVWFGSAEALAGTWLTAATLPLTFTNSWPHPDQFPELALFTWGCWAAASGRFVQFAIAVVVAALNRETAVFLVLLYILTGDLSRRHLSRSTIVVLLWVAVFAGVRAWRGFEHYDYWQLAHNLSYLKLLPGPRDPYYRGYGYFGILLVGGFAAIATQQLRVKPVFVRRGLLVVPAFCAVALAISSIIEARIFTPLYPVVLPAVLQTVFGVTGSTITQATSMENA